ncbi:aminoglycoside phosphotransferase family protein [Streptomyces griseus]|uniref:aminoglycoside phosphotransferase family protein n=1 Tax=Streptomyces griseus TaxID=1911 RepID=UPI000567E494|nr:aminoglycoside phosphotransferase family protein [Streptomyces griseus]
MIDVPEAFATTTVEREGEAGAAWLAELPGIVGMLLDRWGCVTDGNVLYGGVGLIVPVRQADPDRTPAVIKVSFPHPGNVHEPDAFTAWRGHGAVLLHDRADQHFAMLLERAHTSTLAEVDDGDEVVTVAGRLARRLAVPGPPGLPRLQDETETWEEEIRHDAFELPHTMSRRTLDAALATVREVGRVQPDTLIHGDLHGRNILRADREPWLAVDPKGHVGDPAYDGGTLLKSRLPALLAAQDVDLPKAIHRILDLFAEAAELDRERVGRWAQFHAVRAAFHGRRHGFRIARGGPRLDWITELLDQLAELLTE